PPGLFPVARRKIAQQLSVRSIAHRWTTAAHGCLTLRIVAAFALLRAPRPRSRLLNSPISGARRDHETREPTAQSHVGAARRATRRSGQCYEPLNQLRSPTWARRRAGQRPEIFACNRAQSALRSRLDSPARILRARDYAFRQRAARRAQG